MSRHAIDGRWGPHELDDAEARRDVVEDAWWMRMEAAIARDCATQDAEPDPLLPIGIPTAYDRTEWTPDGWLTTPIAGAPLDGVRVTVVLIPFPAALEGL